MKYIKLNFKNREVNTFEANYLQLAADIINNGEYKVVRGEGVYAIFANMLSVDIPSIDNEYFLLGPVGTHKRYKRGIKNAVEEALWILRGSVNVYELQERGVHIWDANTSPEFIAKRGLKDKLKPGFLGPIYGWQLIHNGAPADEYIDENLVKKNKENKIGYNQIKGIIERFRKNNETRTLIATTFYPKDVNKAVLWPCTGIVIQWYLRNGNKLDMIMYQRSCDVLIGLLHNFCMYTILNFIMCRLLSSISNEILSGILTVITGDTHVYDEHIPIFVDSIANHDITLHKPCRIYVPPIKELEDLENLSYNDFRIEDYICEPRSVKYNMVTGSNYQKK